MKKVVILILVCLAVFTSASLPAQQSFSKERVYSCSADEYINDIAAVGDSVIYAVGNKFLALKYQCRAYDSTTPSIFCIKERRIDKGIDSTNELTSICPSAPDKAWAIGKNTIVSFSDFGNIVKNYTNPIGDLYDVFVDGKDIYITGQAKGHGRYNQKCQGILLKLVDDIFLPIASLDSCHLWQMSSSNYNQIVIAGAYYDGQWEKPAVFTLDKSTDKLVCRTFFSTDGISNCGSKLASLGVDKDLSNRYLMTTQFEFPKYYEDKPGSIQYIFWLNANDTPTYKSYYCREVTAVAYTNDHLYEASYEGVRTIDLCFGLKNLEYNDYVRFPWLQCKDIEAENYLIFILSGSEIIAINPWEYDRER